jgi:fructuronate reductase
VNLEASPRRRSSRLGAATLGSLPATVARPKYDRTRTRIGIVHLGPGAFHRAHQAVYFDDVLATAPDWAISAVSLQSSALRDALQPQDGLYTLALMQTPAALRVIGSIREVLCATQQQAAVQARMTDPATRLLTLSVTEKGYCLKGEDLDPEHPDIARDLVDAEAPRSAIGHIVAGLRERHRRGLAPFTVLSCDNLADNGRKLRRATLQYAERVDPALARWIEAEVAFPRSMVDSITPATDDALRERVASVLGCDDAWPVQREPYAQWVIEDRFCNGRPALERVGVQFSDDIGGHDRAKLRLLNGAHSSLAYLGSLLGIETVADAMQNAALAGFVERLMRDDILPTIALPHGLDGDGYVDAILARFANSAIRHKLAQIAWDGTQKLPVRLFGSIADALHAGRPIDRLCLPVAAWMHFVRRQAQSGVALVDPLAATLAHLGRSLGDGAADDVAAFLALDAVFGSLSADMRFTSALVATYVALGDGAASTVARMLRIATEPVQ